MSKKHFSSAIKAATALAGLSSSLEENHLLTSADCIGKANPEKGVANMAGNDDEEDGNLGIPMTFPQILMTILNDEENKNIIAWLPHGKAFFISHRKAFVEKVLNLHFKNNSKYTSFTRKLNRWGFTRVDRGPDEGAYYHMFFQRGNYSLCRHMTCSSSSNNKNYASPFAARQEKPRAALANYPAIVQARTPDVIIPALRRELPSNWPPHAALRQEMPWNWQRGDRCCGQHFVAEQHANCNIFWHPTQMVRNQVSSPSRNLHFLTSSESVDSTLQLRSNQLFYDICRTEMMR